MTPLLWRLALLFKNVCSLTVMPHVVSRHVAAKLHILRKC